MSSLQDKETVKEFYEEVRNDSTDTNWALLTYEENRIVPLKTGVDFEEFKAHFTDDERFYGYLRIETGDEMSKQYKFVFITWIGRSVPPLKKAKVSKDKPFVKDIMKSYTVEICADELSEVSYDVIVNRVKKAG